MVWRTVETQVVRVRCAAPEPLNSTRSDSANGVCNFVIGDVPGPLRRARDRDGLVLGTRGSLPDRPDGRVWLFCPRCKSWNILELVTNE